MEVILNDDLYWTDDIEVVRTFVKVHKAKDSNYYLARKECDDYEKLPENYKEKEVIMII